jgi:hypothetical protein
MAATIATQGGRVLLEHSDMSLASNMAKMAKEGCMRAAIEETKYVIIKPCADVREEKMRGVEFPAYETVRVAMQRHPAMLRQYHMSGCPPCQNGTTKYPQTCWRRKDTAEPPPDWRSQRTPEPTPTLPSTPTVPSSNTSRVQCSEIVNLPVRYPYSHTALPCAESLDDDEDTQHDTDSDPDMLTEEG